MIKSRGQVQVPKVWDPKASTKPEGERDPFSVKVRNESADT